MPGHRHNAGSLKQKNKSHGANGGHSSKRSLKRAQGGKVNAVVSAPIAAAGTTINGMNTGMKLKRLQQTKQMRKQKKAQDFLDRRTGTSIGAPIVILLMPMGDQADANTLANEILTAADRVSFLSVNNDALNGGSFVAVFETLKTRIHVTSVNSNFGSFELLDAAKSADIVIPIFSAKDGSDNAVSKEGLERVSLLRVHGMPAVVGCLQHTTSLSIKLAGEFKRMASKFMTDEFGEHAKLIATNPHQALLSAARQAKESGDVMAATSTEPTGVDISSFLRTVSQMSLRSLAWRDTRAYMLASDVSLVRRADTLARRENAPISDEPCLSVSGYTRGAPLHVDQLIHVPGMGARRILKILSTVDPCPLKPRRNSEGSTMADGSNAVLAEGDYTRGDPLHIWATPNTLIGEQTWPEMDEYAGNGMNDGGDDDTAALKKKRPAGVSDYQAVWLGDDEDGEEEEESNGNGIVSLGSSAGKLLMQSAQNDEEEEEEDDGQFSFLKSEGDGLKLDGFENMTAEEIARDKEDRRRARANDDMEFPDEVDVPDDMLAKDRFARYRSLESFRMSPWDPKESLPRAYGRLFDMGNFKSTQRRVLERDLASARKAEQANLLKLLPSATTVPSSDLPATSFSLPTARGQGGSSGGEVYDMEGEEEGGNGKLMEGSDGLVEDIESNKNEPRADGWISSGTYVTLLLGAMADDQISGDVDESAVVAAAAPLSFARDMESFTKIVQDHSLTLSCSPMSFHALHRHENRLTCVHASIQRASPQMLDPDDVVASKEVLWVVCGFRKWKARPLFSMNNLNSDKHKSERFLLGGAGHFTVASCYGPATYTPCPFLLFREKVLDGVNSIDSTPTMQLVGHGSIGSIDVDRIVLKRVILTGYPARVHKRTAIIKHMFQKPEDVMWFKPAPLVTKLGCEGHIQCPVGDHGLFRVHFGRAIKGHDTVCLHLYKRVYPKFADVAAGEQDDDGAGAVTLSVL